MDIGHPAHVHLFRNCVKNSEENGCEIKITARNKESALLCYESHGDRDYLNEQFIFSLARTRGVQINPEYAKAFEVIRWI